MLLLFAHFDNNVNIWILHNITCSDWYHIINFLTHSVLQDLNNFLVLHIHWLPALLTQVPWKIQRNPKIKRELRPEDQTLQLLHPIDFLPSLRACPKKRCCNLKSMSRWSMPTFMQAFDNSFLFFIASTKRSNLYSSKSCKHLSRNETKNSFWSGGNLPRQNCGESMDFERKSSQMRGEGLGGICVVCAYGPWAQSAHVDVMFIRWRLVLIGRWHRVCWMQWDACVGAIASRICIGLLCCFVFGVVVVFCCCMVTNLSQKRH